MTQIENSDAQNELLENVIATAQRLLRAEKDKSKITPSLIAEKVAKAASVFEANDAKFDGHEIAVGILIQRFSHWVGKGATLKNDLGHVEWLNAARKQDWFYWRR